MLKRISTCALAIAGVVALFGQSGARADTTFEYILAKPLVARAKIGDATGDTLLPPQRVRIILTTDAKMMPVTKFTAGAICQVWILTEKTRFAYLPCDDATAFKAAPQFEYTNAFGPASYPREATHATIDEKGKKFCDAACVHENGADGKPTTRCSGMPNVAEGWIPAGSDKLQALKDFKHIKFRKHRCDGGKCTTIHTACTTDADCYQRATATVAAGLKKLDDYMEANQSKYAGFSIDASNCWRDGYEESKGECYKWEQKHENPREAGGTWAGVNPHSAGNGCDLHLHKDGNDYVGCDAERGKFYDELVTNSKVGAVRYTGEAWHFEWGDQKGAGARCTYPNCPAPKFGCP